VADAGFDFALAVGMANSTGQGHHAVVFQNISVEGIEGWLVDVGPQHALFQIVEDDRLGGSG
jgi:hypothetical protein